MTERYELKKVGVDWRIFDRGLLLSMAWPDDAVGQRLATTCHEAMNLADSRAREDERELRIKLSAQTFSAKEEVGALAQSVDELVETLRECADELRENLEFEGRLRSFEVALAKADALLAKHGHGQ